MKKKIILVPLTLGCSALMLFSCGGSNPSKAFTVTWDLNDGKNKVTQKYAAGAMPIYPEKEPYHVDPIDEKNIEQYGYFFNKWLTPGGEEIKPVNSDVTYVAQYTKKSAVTRVILLSEDIKDVTDKNIRIAYEGSCTGVNWGDGKLVESKPNILEHEYGNDDEEIYTTISIFGEVSGIKLNVDKMNDLNKKVHCVILSPKIDHIDRESFKNVSSLSTLFIPSSVKTVGQGIVSWADPSSCTFYCEADSKPEGWDDKWNDNGHSQALPTVFSTHDVGVTDDGFTHMSVTYNGEPVTAITGYYGPSKGTELTIPSSVKVGDEERDVTALIYNLFKNNQTITKAILPINLRYIGKKTFQNCTSLTDVLEPMQEVLKNIEIIDDNAFDGCLNLEGDLVFDDTSKLVTIGSHAFAGTDLTKIVLPSTLESLGDFAFNRCAQLKVVDLSKANKLVEIGDYAFSNISLGGATSEFVLPEKGNITHIGNYAFSNSLSNVPLIKLPKSIKTIGQMAFNSFSGKISGNDRIVDASEFTTPDEIPSGNIIMFGNSPNSIKVQHDASINKQSFIDKGWPSGISYDKKEAI